MLNLEEHENQWWYDKLWNLKGPSKGILLFLLVLKGHVLT